MFLNNKKTQVFPLSSEQKWKGKMKLQSSEFEKKLAQILWL